MKSIFATLPLFLISFGLAATTYAGVVASGGQSTLLPTLSLTHNGGNIAPPFNWIQCDVYLTSKVVVQAGNRPALRRDLVFTAAVPSIDEMLSLVEQASNGLVKPMRGANPDAGSTLYSAQTDQAHGSKKVLLMDRGFLRGRKNDSNAAATLIEFIARNCEL